MHSPTPYTPVHELALLGLNLEFEGQVVQVRSRIVVGRALDCDVRLEDVRASRQHAAIILRSGQLFVEDLGSQNGTWVNGARIERLRLRPDDVVKFGATRFMVCPTDPNSRAVQMVEETPAVHKLVRRVDPDRISRPSEMSLDSWFREIGATGIDSDVRRLPWLRRQTRNFAVLFEVSQRVQQIEQSAEMLNSVMTLLVEVLRVDRGVVALVGGDPGQLRPEVVVYGSGAVPGGPIAMSRTVAEQVLTARCGVISQDAHADHRFDASESLIQAPTRSLLVVPLLAGQRVLGLVELSSSIPGNAFSEDDLEFMSVVASMLGSAFHRRELAVEQELTIRRLEDVRRRLLGTQRQLLRDQQVAIIGRSVTRVMHEVRNHLVPLQMADLIKERYPSDSELAENVDLMMEAAASIEDMVRELLHFARGARVDTVLTRDRLGTVAEGAFRFVRFDELVRPHRLEVVLNEDPIVLIDERRLRQVVINLVRNAAQAIAHDHGHIIIRVDRDGDEATLSVIDNGTGIPDEVVARVFEPMFTTRGEEGMGMGLQISRQIVEAHHGRLTFATQLSRGTTFTIRLPLNLPRPSGPTTGKDEDLEPGELPTEMLEGLDTDTFLLDDDDTG